MAGHHRMLLIYRDAWFQTETGVVLTALLLLPFLPLAVRALAWVRRRLGQAPRRARRTATLEVGLAYGTAIPIWLTMLPGGNREISLVPFRDMATMPPYEIVGNLLLLSAVGFLVPLRFRRLASVPRTALVAMAVSGAIETCQYLLPVGRVASVDDVILNTVGAAAAALVSRPWWASSRGGITRPAPDRPTWQSDPLRASR